MFGVSNAFRECDLCVRDPRPIWLHLCQLLSLNDIKCYSESMNISLTKHYNQFVEKKVKSGRYESRSEVVRAALRLMETVEARQETLPYIGDLEEKLLEGLSSPATPMTKNDWENLRKRVSNDLRKPKAKKK